MDTSKQPSFQTELESIRQRLDAMKAKTPDLLSPKSALDAADAKQALIERIRERRKKKEQREKRQSRKVNLAPLPAPTSLPVPTSLPDPSSLPDLPPLQGPPPLQGLPPLQGGATDDPSSQTTIGNVVYVYLDQLIDNSTKLKVFFEKKKLSVVKPYRDIIEGLISFTTKYSNQGEDSPPPIEGAAPPIPPIPPILPEPVALLNTIRDIHLKHDKFKSSKVITKMGELKETLKLSYLSSIKSYTYLELVSVSEGQVIVDKRGLPTPPPNQFPIVIEMVNGIMNGVFGDILIDGKIKIMKLDDAVNAMYNDYILIFDAIRREIEEIEKIMDMGLAVKSVKKQALLDGLLNLIDCSGILDYYRKLLVGLDGVVSSSNLSQEILLDLLGEGFMDSLVKIHVEQTIKAVVNNESLQGKKLTEIMESDAVLEEIQNQIDEERRRKEEAERQRQRKVPQYTRQGTGVDTGFRVDEEEDDPIASIKEKYELKREDSEKRRAANQPFEPIDVINELERLELEEEEERQKKEQQESLQPKTFDKQYYESLKTLKMKVPSDGNFTKRELRDAFRAVTQGVNENLSQTEEEKDDYQEKLEAWQYLQTFLEED